MKNLNSMAKIVLYLGLSLLFSNRSWAVNFSPRVERGYFRCAANFVEKVGSSGAAGYFAIQGQYNEKKFSQELSLDYPLANGSLLRVGVSVMAELTGKIDSWTHKEKYSYRVRLHTPSGQVDFGRADLDHYDFRGFVLAKDSLTEVSVVDPVEDVTGKRILTFFCDTQDQIDIEEAGKFIRWK